LLALDAVLGALADQGFGVAIGPVARL